MERDNYKYDIALSFAEEDRNIAVALARELAYKDVKVYYYPDNIAETAGKRLTQKLTEIYRNDAKHAVVIVTDKYFKKKYAKIEFEAIKNRANESPNVVYMIPLLAGDIGLLEQYAIEQVGALTWEYNPEKIAEILLALLGSTKQNLWRDDKCREYRFLLSQNDTIINQIDNAVIIYQSKNKFIYWIMPIVIATIVLLLIWDNHQRSDTNTNPIVEIDTDSINIVQKPNADNNTHPLPLKDFYALSVSRDTITNIKLEQDDTIRISATGMMSPSDITNNCGPEGIAEQDMPGGSIISWRSIRNKTITKLISQFKQWNYAALIYRLDTTGIWKLYSSEANFDIAKKPGTLEFKVNDIYQNDNIGGYDVNVTVWRTKNK